MQNAAVGIAHTSLDGSFFRVNKHFCSILGYDEPDFENLTVKDLILPGEWDQDLLAIKNLFCNKIATIRREKQFIRKDKKTIWGRVTVSMARESQNDSGYAIMVVEEITDRIEAENKRKTMEGQLRHAQRMEAIGTLAGGIAHDFNNILGVIMGYTDIARGKLPHDTPAGKSLDAIKTATNRAKDLVRHILTSCRQVEQEKLPIRVIFIVKEVLDLLRASLPTTIEIETNLEKCNPVLADPTQIHQVIMNLCTNAYHAMEEKGGCLTLSLKMVFLGDAQQTNPLALIPGYYNLLEVKDTGSGIKHALLERIFEPYFTTKPKNRGTGLGLSVVHGIIKSHDGEIFVSSDEMGTCFKIYLPCLEEEITSRTMEVTGTIPCGTERLLIVDDNGPYLEMMTDLLTDLGYQVTATLKSVEALEMIQKDPDHFDCLITDYTMPGMTGSQLAQKVLKEAPNLPIIMYTGINEIIARKNATNLGIKAFLSKPVVLIETANTLRSVLDTPKK
jgi:PAS domain S-box-containing protein